MRRKVRRVARAQRGDPQHFRIASRVFDVGHYHVEQAVFDKRHETAVGDLPFGARELHAEPVGFGTHALQRREPLRIFRDRALEPEQPRRFEVACELQSGRLVEAPVAIDHHFDVRADRLAYRIDAVDPGLDPARRACVCEILPVHTVERRDFDRAKSGGDRVARCLRNAVWRTVARAAVDVGINAHGFARIPAEQRVDRHAGLPRAQVRERLLERAEDGTRNQGTGRMRVYAQQRGNVGGRFADKTAADAFEVGELGGLPAIERSFADAGASRIVSDAHKKPVGFFGYVKH